MAEIGRSAIRAPLSGWRNIAAYLACDQSTVKRWAATRNLPVYRPAGSEARKGVPVFAYPDELDQWLRGQSSGSRSDPAAELHRPSEVESEEAISALPPTPPAPRRRGRRLLLAAVAVTAVLTVGAGILLPSQTRKVASSTPILFAAYRPKRGSCISMPTICGRSERPSRSRKRRGC